MQVDTPNKADTDSEKAKESRVFHLGYPAYPFEDNISRKLQEEINIASLNTMAFQGADELMIGLNENNQLGDYAATDMDMPGTDLDDIDEAIGAEDEENNHYSLGGDNHNDLDENN